MYCDVTNCIYNDECECCAEIEYFADCMGEMPIVKEE